MDAEGYYLDPRCLPGEALAVWPRLDRRGKQLLALALINGINPAEAVASLDVPPEPPPKPEETAHEIFECPVPGCGLKIEGEVNPEMAKLSLLTHQRLVHPHWQA